MAIRIKCLTCRVTVKTARKASPVHKSEAPPRPSLLFALPQSVPGGEEPPPPSQTATEGNDAQNGGSGSSGAAGRADPRAVSDRVYELMRDELRLAQLRAGRERNN